MERSLPSLRWHPSHGEFGFKLRGLRDASVRPAPRSIIENPGWGRFPVCATRSNRCVGERCQLLVNRFTTSARTGTHLVAIRRVNPAVSAYDDKPCCQQTLFTYWAKAGQSTSQAGCCKRSYGRPLSRQYHKLPPTSSTCIATAAPLSKRDLDEASEGCFKDSERQERRSSYSRSDNSGYALGLNSRRVHCKRCQLVRQLVSMLRKARWAPLDHLRSIDGLQTTIHNIMELANMKRLIGR